MRKKVLGLSLAILFFGSIATSTFGITTVIVNGDKITKVDDDKNKTKTKKSESKKECASKSDCCGSAKAKSCDEKKGDDKK